MKQILHLFLFLLWSVPISAQNSFSVIIKQSSDSASISNVTFFNKEKSIFGISNLKGECLISVPNESNDSIIYFKSLQFNEVGFTIEELKKIKILYLTPAIFELPEIAVSNTDLSNREILAKAYDVNTIYEYPVDSLSYKFYAIQSDKEKSYKRISSELMFMPKGQMAFNKFQQEVKSYESNGYDDFAFIANLNMLENILYPVHPKHSLQRHIKRADKYGREYIIKDTVSYYRIYKVKNDLIVFECVVNAESFRITHLRDVLGNLESIELHDGERIFSSSLCWEIHFNDSIPSVPNSITFIKNSYNKDEAGVWKMNTTTYSELILQKAFLKETPAKE